MSEDAWQRRLKDIKLLALDVDGVLTEGSIVIGLEGELCKHFNAKDGLGIAVALRSGLEIAIVTGRKSAIVQNRAKELGIKLVLEGITDKKKVLKDIAVQKHLSLTQIAFMGDDLNDLPAFEAAGMVFAPADAALDVVERAHYVTHALGGRGAIREVIELILRSQGSWQGIVDSYLQQGEGDRQ